MSDITTTGMILSVMPVGEYDRRVELLSSTLGRISAFARGARNPGSSLVSATRVFAFGEFRLYQGRNSYTIHSAGIREYFDDLTKNVEHMYQGFYYLELARYFSRENLEARDMLTLLYYGLKALESPFLTGSLVRSIVELKMLEINGLCPPAERMTETNLSGGCIKALNRVISMPPERVFSFTLTEEVRREFSGVVTGLLRRNVDRQFQSEKLLEAMKDLTYNT